MSWVGPSAVEKPFELCNAKVFHFNYLTYTFQGSFENGIRKWKSKCQSAHSRSLSLRVVTFISTNFFSHSLGSMAATVNNPNGGWVAFFEINFRAYLRLQKVSGYCGYTRRIFMRFSLFMLCLRSVEKRSIHLLLSELVQRYCHPGEVCERTRLYSSDLSPTTISWREPFESAERKAVVFMRAPRLRSFWKYTRTCWGVSL
jgi:hypothetical protein